MRAQGVSPGAWFTDPHMMGFCPPSADFVIAEIETPSDYSGTVGSIPHLDPAMPKAIITNFGGLLVQKPDGSTDVPASRARCKPLNDAGFDVQTEFYLQGLEAGATPAHLEYIARTQCGFTTRVAPAFGVYTPYTLAAYEKWTDVPGWGVYLAEYL